MAIEAFSNLSITISDGGTVPSLDYLFNKTYVNIGSGNILKISWNTPTAAGNAVDSYKVYVLIYDSDSASYKTKHNANVGNVNEFYLKSTLFESITQSFIPAHIYVEAISKYGTAYNGISNTVSVNISRGCGMYVKVTEGYTQPIMKRTIAFTKVTHKLLADSTGTPVTDSDGNPLYTKVSNVQDDATGWTLMQEFYTKDSNNTWQASELMYEVLTDANGEIVLDQNDDAVYVL